jgi:hypothetical protein
MVLYPSGSGSALCPEGRIPAAATSLYDKVVPAGIEIVGKVSAGRAAASLWDISAARKRCSPVIRILRSGPGGNLNKAMQILNFPLEQRVIIFKVSDLFSYITDHID